MNPTIDDVAKEAGVSTATVSRVLNKKDYPVKIKTKEKVEEAIKKLNYTPNHSAVSLVTKKSFSVGVLVPTLTNPYFTKIYEAIKQYAYEKGYTIFLCDTKSNHEMEVYYINNLLSRNIDGFIIIDGPDNNKINGFFEKIAKYKEIVIINGYSKDIDCNYLICNQEKGALDALDYLISLGHREIGFIRGFTNDHNAYSYDIKEEVFKNRLLSDKNLIFKEENIIRIENYDDPDILYKCRDVMVDFFNKEKIPTAFYASNDLMAIATLEAARIRGLRIPEDISLIGNDNIVFSEFCSPKLTTVDYRTTELGLEAIKFLLNNIESKPKYTRKIILNSNLLIRESCKDIRKNN